MKWKTYIYANIHMWMFIAVLFICNSQRLRTTQRSINPLTGEWINETWLIHKMEYYSAIERNKVLTHITTWMNVKNIILSERSQTQKVTYFTNTFKAMEMGNTLVIAWGLEWELRRITNGLTQISTEIYNVIIFMLLTYWNYVWDMLG